ncbi:MAG: hypothetical protein ACT4QF_00010 [Sporichthyaceae bacterium]
MPTTEIGRPGRYDADLDQSRRRRRDPVARVSLLFGLTAFAAIFVPALRTYGIAACAFAFLFALVARRRARRQGGEMALAGLVLAVFAAIGLVASASAFGSVAGPQTPTLAPTVGPDGKPSAAVVGVVGRDIDVVFGATHVELEEFGLRRMNVPVTITNRTDRRLNLDLDFAARSSGKTVTTDSAYVADLAPGQSAQIRIFNIVNDRLLDELAKAEFVTTGAVAY